MIGFCVRGLILYDIVNKDTKIPTHKLSWKQIENITFKVAIVISRIVSIYMASYQQRRLELHIVGNDDALVYNASSPKK